MSFCRIFLAFFLFAFSSWVYAYEQQGFVNYTEQAVWVVDFQCEKECIILLGTKKNFDTIHFAGNLTGSGLIGYGILNNQEVIPWAFRQIDGTHSDDFVFSLRDLTYYDQIPESIPVLLFVEWMVQGNHASFWLEKSSFADRIATGWNDFWKSESLTPYSINFRYWVKILWVSIITIAYWIFVLFTLFLLLVPRFRKKEYFISLGIILFLIIGTRNLYTYTWIVKSWLQSYTYAEADQKTFFDLWDYIVFTDKIRTALELDTRTDKKDCTIFIDSIQDWPFKPHWDSQYLRPCHVVEDKNMADYSIFYHKPLVQDGSGTILLQYNQNFLLKNHK